MVQQLIRRYCVLSCAFLLLLGCKKPETAADVEPFVPFELLDAGEEPRALLRYAIADGTTTTTTMSFKTIPGEKSAPKMTESGLQRLKVKAVFGPTELVEDEIRYDYEIVDSNAVARPGASEKLLEDIEQSAALLKGTGASIAINDRGNLRGTRSSQETKAVPLRLLWIIGNTVSNLSMVGLPPEEVGVGARWRVRAMLTFYGIKLEQQTTYTLIERTGDEIVLDVEYERVGDRQVVDLSEDDSLVEVESMRATATGRIRLDLKTLGSNGTATGTNNIKVVMVEDGNRENREINEDYELRISSTTTVREAGSETD